MSYRLRLATPDDAGSLVAIYRPIVEATFISFELTPPSASQMADRIEATLRERPWLVCSHGDTIVGYAYADSYRSRPAYQWAIEVSAYVATAHRRRGVARALYVALLELLRRQEFVTAFAIIALPNPASVAFHESLGFEPAGVWQGVGYKHARWHDVGWWQLALTSPPAEPNPPVPLAAMNGPSIAAAVARGEACLLKEET